MIIYGYPLTVTCNWNCTSFHRFVASNLQPLFSVGGITDLELELSSWWHPTQLAMSNDLPGLVN